MAGLDFWNALIGNNDREEMDFEGFTLADLVKLQPNDAKSDLEYDWAESFVYSMKIRQTGSKVMKK